jgi:hypothetical protein
LSSQVIWIPEIIGIIIIGTIELMEELLVIRVKAMPYNPEKTIKQTTPLLN